MSEAEEFEFEGIRPTREPVEFELSQVDRDILSEASKIGGPLWKYARWLADQVLVLTEVIANSPLNTAADVWAAKELQIRRATYINLVETWERALTRPPTEGEAPTENSNG